MDNTESKFITNFETSVTQIGTFGTGYQPPAPIVSLTALQALLTQDFGGEKLTMILALDYAEAV